MLYDVFSPSKIYMHIFRVNVWLAEYSYRKTEKKPMLNDVFQNVVDYVHDEYVLNSAGLNSVCILSLLKRF